jgi:glycerophosphoryl diester phosphodiesterase
VHQSLVSSNLIENIHAARRRAIVWTVNDAPSMRRMADLEVDGIVSDDTELLVNTLRPALKLAAQASAI